MSKEIFRRSWLMGTAATAMAAAMATAPAFAQDTAVEDDDDVIVVRGFKKSIQDSIATKAEETSIVEAISAEEIGKLPDVSIAEALARLPGLAAQRLRGRAQVISVRGLGPDFTTALLNGREQVTAGDNRGVEFDQFPAELLSQVVVYKTPDASLMGQGLAGTADLRTIRPLEYGRRSLQVGAFYEFNDQDALNAGTENTGHRLTGSYVDQFADGTIGIVLGVATQSTPTQAERFEAWGYPVNNGAAIIGGAKPYSESRELERDAFLGTLEWQPNETFSASIDAFYSEFEDVGVLRGVELPLFWSGAQLQPNATVENNVTTAGTFNGVQGVLRNDNRFREAELFSFGANAKWQVSDRLELEFDYSRSSVDRLDTDLETYSGTGRGFGNGASDNLGFSVDDNGITTVQPQLDYADPSLFLLTDPQGWGQVGFIKQPQTEDELDQLRLSATRDFDEDGLLDSIEVGVNYTTREKNKNSVESFLRGFSGANAGADAVAVPSEFLLGSSDFSFVGIGPILSYDSLALFNSGFYTTEANTNADVVTKAWLVEEDVLTAYLQANILGDLGSVPVRGNVGVQWVNTDQSSTGATPGDTGFSEITAGDEYSEVLPSLNLSFEVANDTFVRTSVARTLARARMDDLRASQTLNLNNQVCGFQDLDNDGTAETPFFDATAFNGQNQVCFNGSGGNPLLRPYTAWAYDLSVEKYFANRTGYVSLALFRKDIEDFVFNGPGIQFDYTQAANAIFGESFVSSNPDVTVGFANAPDNTDGGYIQGIEVATNIPGEVLFPAPFDGLGLFASYSYNDSEITPFGGDAITVPGLSERIANVTVYYERNGFEARVSNRYRSEFLGEVTGFGANRETRTVQDENVIDAQIGYSFQKGPLEGVSVFLQGQNLTDEEFVTLTTTADGEPHVATGLVRDHQTYGRTFLIGVNWKMN